MCHKEQWIWLPKNKYEDEQITVFSGFDSDKAACYTIAEMKRNYLFDDKIVKADLRFSGDSAFQLYLNKSVVATGPVCVGGDFIGNETRRENFYAFETTVYPESNELDFFARVKLVPVQICEYSKGHGGFMLSAVLTFENGSQELITTDETWLVRKNGAFQSISSYDARIVPDEFVNAEVTENIWNTETAPIPVRVENEIFCNNSNISVSAYEKKTVVLTFDKIWAGFVNVRAEAKGEISVSVKCRELNEDPRVEDLVFSGNGEYRGFCMQSAGNIEVDIENKSESEAKLTVSFIETHYPVYDEVSTVTCDTELNAVLETCKHTLKICRQTHHLDSPRHCEPMACTGDYYIESLMTLFSFGDMRLAEFDLIRTAYMLERENGRMFHTTYSLIWVRMLYDVYMITGNRGLLEKCEKALRLLLNRFQAYIGENGLIETPPDYMFVDWIYIDGITMHHPPKALGQTCLNMFYFGALKYAEKVFRELSNNKEAEICADKSAKIKAAVNDILFDSEKGIYFMGLNTPTKEELVANWKWMPQNTDKRYYLKHANVLAAYFGICDDDLAKELVRKIMTDEIEGECQPYFLHYLLEAVNRLDLCNKYTLEIINRWKAPVCECSKGLVEGFLAPEPTYSFDHSHAWGGTPLYSLPKALTGLEIIKSGMKEITLSPSLLGLNCATAEFITPFGKVTCEMKAGEEPKITAPEEIKVTVLSDN